MDDQLVNPNSEAGEPSELEVQPAAQLTLGDVERLWASVANQEEFIDRLQDKYGPIEGLWDEEEVEQLARQGDQLLEAAHPLASDPFLPDRDQTSVLLVSEQCGQTGPLPPPGGGYLVEEILIARGSADEISNVLDDEFGVAMDRTWFLSRHGGEGRYWHIEQFAGTIEELRYLWSILTSQTAGRAYHEAIHTWTNRSSKVGYVFVSARPVVPVRFFVDRESARTLVEQAARAVVGELLHWGFLVDGFGGHATARAQPTAHLTELQQGILSVIQRRLHQRLEVTDNAIAMDLMEKQIYNRTTGEMYSREYINRARRKLIKLGFDIGVVK